MKCKRLLSILLTLCLLLGTVMVFPVAAAESDPPLVDGAYQLDSAEDLLWFSDLVYYQDLSGERFNAVLTADIDMTGQDWIPIGPDQLRPFSGTFDGQGHTITGLKNNSYYNGGLFSHVMSATIKNVGLLNVDFHGSYSGGIAAHIMEPLDASEPDSVITNSFVTGKVRSTLQDREGVAGGIVGDTFGALTISNCYFLGTVELLNNTSGDKACSSGGIVGKSKTTSSAKTAVQNCCYNEDLYPSGGHQAIGTWSDSEGISLSNVVAKTKDQFASGDVAYTLNGGKTSGSLPYYQTLGTESSPRLRGDIVYRHQINCSEHGYTNSPAPHYDHTYEDGICIRCSQPDPNFGHSFDENGFCTHCDDAVESTPDLNNDGFVEISNAGQLLWFSRQVDAGQLGLNAVLTNDITFNENVVSSSGSLNSGSFRVWEPIGYDSSTADQYASYSGIFDGQGYTISGLYLTATAADCGIFGVLNKTAVVKNLHIADSYIQGEDYVGGLASTNGGTIENCTFEGAVVAKLDLYSYISVGGLVAYNTGTIRNCSFEGTITAHSGNVSGIAGEQSGGSNISNCFFTGSITLTNPSNESFVGAIAYVASNVSNCYFNSDLFDGPGFAMGGNQDAALGKSSTQFASGEVAFLLGDAFGQKLGTDTSPVLGGETVYYGYENCQSTKKTYSNDLRYDNSQDHHATYNANGYCTACGALQYAEQNADGAYEIGNIGQLLWFVAEVNGGKTDINAVLTANITANRDVIADDGSLNSGSFSVWTPIGSNSAPYTGSFDGQNHSISGLYASSAASYVGLFGCIGTDGVVQNVRVIDTYFSGSSWVGGIAGKSEGAIHSCSFDGTISASNYPTGGIVGANRGSISACTNNGSISGIGGAAGIAGYNIGTIADCTNNGNVTATANPIGYFGGIVGLSDGGSISGCTNNGNITGNTGVDGIVGDSADTTVENCTNNGVITENGTVIGGENPGETPDETPDENKPVYGSDLFQKYWKRYVNYINHTRTIIQKLIFRFKHHC